jgi:hypothetical protein
MDTTTDPPSEDKFVFWPMLLVAGSLFIGVFFGSYPEYGDHALAAWIGVILSILVMLLIGLFSFFAAAYAASVRRWRQATSMAVFPAAIVIAVLYPDFVMAPIVTVVTYIYRLVGFDMDLPY